MSMVEELYPDGFDFTKPDYTKLYAARVEHYKSLGDPANVAILSQAHVHYSSNPVDWIQDFCVTVDPRKAASKDKPSRMPFVLFPRQRELIEWLHWLLERSEYPDLESDGLCEKTRDCGLSWLCVVFGLWIWTYMPNAQIGFGSLKADSVDSKGNPKALLEKVRIVIRNLPPFMRPPGYNEKKDALKNKIMNRVNGSVIVGESGDKIGRSDRYIIFFKDEAQPLHSKILTPTGWKTMGDMNVGSTVIGSNGNPTKVIGINNAGKHPIYEIKFSDGKVCECSLNHKWTVDKVLGKKERLILTTKDLLKDYIYNTSKGKFLYKYRTPVCDVVQFKKSKKTFSLDPYLIGCLLGDGSVGSVPKSGPKITTADQEIAESFSKLLPKGCSITKGQRYEYRLVDDRFTGYQGSEGFNHRSRARQAVVDAGISGCRSWEKFIPDPYKLSSPEDRLSVLQGLMDTDGSMANGVPTFHSCSEQLAQDVLFIVRSLGGFGSCNVKSDPRGYRDQYVVQVHIPEGVPFRLNRKIKLFKRRKQTYARAIISIKKKKAKEVRCISVEAKDGLYLTDDFIVTHNSAHYEHAEDIEAALSVSSFCKIDVSSVNGPGNLFYTKRHSFVDDNVFVFRWEDDERKTKSWYDREKKKYTDAGIEHLFAQEIDRDYSAAVSGLFIPAKYVLAAVDYPLEARGTKRVALDVADDVEHGDTNVLMHRYGNVVSDNIEEWGGEDTGYSAGELYLRCVEIGADEAVFDRIGVGAGIHTEMKKIVDEVKFKVHGFVANATVFEEWEEYLEGVTNRDLFENAKAQATWNVRMRCQRCWENKFKGAKHPDESLISLPNDPKLIMEISRPKRMPGQKAKIMVEPKHKLAQRGLKSPNRLEALVMLFAEIDWAEDLRMIMG